VSDDDDSDIPTPQIDLSADRQSVRQEARRNLYTGKTYNSLENVSEFFKQRGVNVPVRGPVAQAAAPVTDIPVSRQGGLFAHTAPAQAPVAGSGLPPPKPRVVLPSAPPPPKRPSSTGTVVEHPKYGRGTVVRREGDGADAKVVVIFEHYGLKKLVEKYAGLKKA